MEPKLEEQRHADQNLSFKLGPFSIRIGTALVLIDCFDLPTSSSIGEEEEARLAQSTGLFFPSIRRYLIVFEALF